MVESHTRSIVKALSWRVFAFVITTVVVFMVKGNVELALSIGVIDTVIKLGAYYGHERLWTRIPIGQKPAPDFEI